MAESGLTIDSPKTGQTLTFITTAAASDGAELTIEVALRPDAFVPQHVHVSQEETFEVLAGTVTFTVDGAQVLGHTGETIVVPAGVGHAFRNRSGADARLRATVRPALRTEDLFEQLFRLGAAGKVNRMGAPNPLKSAALIREFREEFFYLAAVPVKLQRLLAGAR